MTTARPASDRGHPRDGERDGGSHRGVTRLWDAVQSRARAAALHVVDRGLFGLKPLETHVVVCGFPRTGSSLLQVMVQICVDDVRTFSGEANALRCARGARRNHRFMVTKRPSDALQIAQIRAFYEDRGASPRFLFMIRDPRDVLTSVHASRPSTYYVRPDRWTRLFAAWRRHRSDEDVTVVRYEDLVGDPAAVERELVDRIGWQVSTPFEGWYEAARDRQPTWSPIIESAMGGLRPLQTRARRWTRPEHGERLLELLRAMPELPEQLIEMGYETSHAWATDLEP